MEQKDLVPSFTSGLAQAPLGAVLRKRRVRSHSTAAAGATRKHPPQQPPSAEHACCWAQDPGGMFGSWAIPQRPGNPHSKRECMCHL